MCCYLALHPLHLYKTKQNRGYQLQTKMNHALPTLEAVDRSFRKEQLFLHQIHKFVLRDWRCNIVAVIGSWYRLAKSESSVYFRISFNGIVWTEAIFFFFFFFFFAKFYQILIK